MKQQVGFKPDLGPFGLQLNALTTWPQCHSMLHKSGTWDPNKVVDYV